MIRLNEAMDPHPGADAPHLDVVAEIRRIFAEGGLLEQHLGLQFRPQQAEMAMATAAAMAGEQTLFAEAGTGVGKSLAYLLPGLLQAVKAKRPFLVSTHTIALQQQIETKDLPLCRKLFAAEPALKECAAFRHTVLLGRANYLCGTRLRQALETRTELFPSAQQEELQRIADWAEQSATGLRQELEPPPDPEVWDWVHADAHACNQRNCTTDSCPFRRARAAIRRAHLVIVNHSLLFALLAAGQSPEASVPGVLLPEDFVVLDEAHVLPSVATDYFGQRISEEGLRRQLLKLFHLRRGKRRGLLPSLRAHDLCLAVQTVQERADSFFDDVRTTYLRSGRPFRFREPEWLENPVDAALRQLVHGLARREERLEEGPRRDELEGVRKSLQAYRDGMTEVLQLGDPESVYWSEAGGRKGSIVHLRSAPLSVAEPLRRALFSRRTSVVLTSATLAEGADMTSFQERVGAPDTEARRVASPFDYSLQMEILLHTSAPEPNSADHSLCTDFIATEIGILTGQIEGGSLVLFTSYRDLEAVHARLMDSLRTGGRPLFRQGEGISRAGLLRRMRECGNAVLLGTDSFWTGVDLPGPALSQLILTRLPFENPSHPVAEARAEECRRRGRSPFADITLPAALTKFRQGLGRLIRTQTDEGRLVILDSRILQKSYGGLFLEVLPHGRYRKIASAHEA